LPDLCSWNKKEQTLVNSDGTAVYSGNMENPVGGEINSLPTFSIKDQMAILNNLIPLLKANGGVVNYRCNSQVHVGIGDVSLREMRNIEQYVFDNYEDKLTSI